MDKEAMKHAETLAWLLFIQIATHIFLQPRGLDEVLSSLFMITVGTSYMLCCAHLCYRLLKNIDVRPTFALVVGAVFGMHLFPLLFLVNLLYYAGKTHPLINMVWIVLPIPYAGYAIGDLLFKNKRLTMLTYTLIMLSLCSFLIEYGLWTIHSPGD